MHQFVDQYMCEFVRSPAEELLFAVANTYVRDTEAFDRTVCTGPIIRGSVMPASPRERALINRNARSLFDDLIYKGQGRYTRADLRVAIALAERSLP